VGPGGQHPYTVRLACAGLLGGFGNYFGLLFPELGDYFSLLFPELGDFFAQIPVPVGNVPSCTAVVLSFFDNLFYSVMTQDFSDCDGSAIFGISSNTNRNLHQFLSTSDAI
jgi:hypothetical protein